MSQIKNVLDEGDLFSMLNEISFNGSDSMKIEVFDFVKKSFDRYTDSGNNLNSMINVLWFCGSDGLRLQFSLLVKRVSGQIPDEKKPVRKIIPFPVKN